jgi:hypothetical protein
MLNIFWRIIAKILARPAIAEWLIKRAQLTPYQHIMPADGTEMYMGRWWFSRQSNRKAYQLKLEVQSRFFCGSRLESTPLSFCPK